jgi:hypothetical protein
MRAPGAEAALRPGLRPPSSPSRPKPKPQIDAPRLYFCGEAAARPSAFIKEGRKPLPPPSEALRPPSPARLGRRKAGCAMHSAQAAPSARLACQSAQHTR